MAREARHFLAEAFFLLLLFDFFRFMIFKAIRGVPLNYQPSIKHRTIPLGPLMSTCIVLVDIPRITVTGKIPSLGLIPSKHSIVDRS